MKLSVKNVCEFFIEMWHYRQKKGRKIRSRQGETEIHIWHIDLFVSCWIKTMSRRITNSQMKAMFICVLFIKIQQLRYGVRFVSLFLCCHQNWCHFYGKFNCIAKVTPTVHFVLLLSRWSHAKNVPDPLNLCVYRLYI